MCTVSVIAIDGGYRLVTNRDEKRGRVSAEYPFNWGMNKSAIGPLDPAGGGTWVAARPGLTLCVLNYNLEPSPEPPANTVSRGRIIPKLIEHPSAHAAIAALEASDLSRFVPFRLVAVDLNGPLAVIEARWNQLRFTRVDHPMREPACFASSGLGDSIVADRLPLFDRMVRPNPTAESQDAYHTHRWPDRGAASVFMDRPAARTVSITIVEDTAAGLHMHYRPIDVDGSVEQGVAMAVAGNGTNRG
jgi:hypothetical protein